MYLKPFTCQSAMSPKETPTQGMKQKLIVLTLYWVSTRILLMELADSCNWHTSFPIHARYWRIYWNIPKVPSIPHKHHFRLLKIWFLHEQYFYQKFCNLYNEKCLSKWVMLYTNNYIKHNKLWELSELTSINIYLWVLMSLAVAQPV
jgi:hypothetical protein